MKTKQIINEAINCYSFDDRLKVDKRRKEVKKAIEIGFSVESIREARIKRFKRQFSRLSSRVITFDEKRRFLAEIKQCSYRGQGEGDWRQIHRETSNGLGWVIIAPDEPANNWYMNDRNVVKLLYNKYVNKH